MKKLEDIKLTSLLQYIKTTVPPHFRVEPGIEAYAYYAHLSTKLKAGAKISDLGTLQGLSALALSYNPKVNVISYDIDLSKNIVAGKENIKFVEGDMFDHLDEILKSDLILVDVDPHDGLQEERFLDLLIDNSYKGITIWDDIHHNVEMATFWQRVKVDKVDVTSKGHHSGTGMIEFK